MTLRSGPKGTVASSLHSLNNTISICLHDCGIHTVYYRHSSGCLAIPIRLKDINDNPLGADDTAPPNRRSCLRGQDSLSQQGRPLRLQGSGALEGECWQDDTVPAHNPQNLQCSSLLSWHLHVHTLPESESILRITPSCCIQEKERTMSHF